MTGEELDCCGAYAFCAACYEDGFVAEGGVGGVLGCHCGFLLLVEVFYDKCTGIGGGSMSGCLGSDCMLDSFNLATTAKGQLEM